MELKRLGDIIKITSGGTPLTSRREYYDNGNIPWAKTGDLKVRHLSIIPDSISQLGLENSSAKIFPVNTVLIAMYGATIGNCSILKTAAATYPPDEPHIF
jgi:restriction endonuclease S subunit